MHGANLIPIANEYAYQLGPLGILKKSTGSGADYSE